LVQQFGSAGMDSFIDGMLMASAMRVMRWKLEAVEV
jgi:hypothetical protein